MTDATTALEETGAEAANEEQASTGEGGQPDSGAHKSALADPGADKAVTSPAGWPSDWRQKLAGEDADALKRLERYKSPADMAKALTEAQNKIRSTRAMPTLSDKPTDEELAAYRKEMGIPEKPEAYLEKLPDGLVIGDDDKPIFEGFAKAAHAANIPEPQAKAMLDWYAGLQEQAAVDQKKRDDTARMAAIEDLRGELGGEYLSRMNAVKTFVESMGEGVTEALFGARLPDGSLFGDNPQMLRWLMDMQAQVNPMGTVAPADGKTTAETVASRIAEIENIMRTERARYNKDTAMQEELRKLYEFDERQKA